MNPIFRTKIFRVPLFNETFLNSIVRFKKSDCRRAIVEIPPDPPDKICKKPCRETKKPLGVLHKIKLKIIEGGTNFGAPFARLRCKGKEIAGDICGVKKEKQKALPPPKKGEIPAKLVPPIKVGGVQVAILGAETIIGQYVALILKQCSCIKRLRLFETSNTCGCTRRLFQVVEDLRRIDTNCNVQAHYCTGAELERCLQSSDIVLMLESTYVTSNMPLEQRFCLQAPLVKYYVDCIANECPKAFIIVCTTPIDCMVPLVALTLQETGWYNPKKLLGSLAVPEMRASTLAARALGLEPFYTRVPCVGGTEGEALVPLFSRAVDQFDFAVNNALMMTDVIRSAPESMARVEECYCPKSADLSEAHALSGLVTKVAHALLCDDVPNVSGFVETNPKQVVSPASKYMATEVILSCKGIIKHCDLPPGLNDYELQQLSLALDKTVENIQLAEKWHSALMEDENVKKSRFSAKNFLYQRDYERLNVCIRKHVA